MIAILRKTAARGPLPEMTQMMSLHAGVMETMNAFGEGVYPGGSLDPVLAENVTRDANRIPDTMHKKIRNHFSREQIVELTFFISYMNCLNHFNNALRVEYDGGYPD